MLKYPTKSNTWYNETTHALLPPDTPNQYMETCEMPGGAAPLSPKDKGKRTAFLRARPRAYFALAVRWLALGFGIYSLPLQLSADELGIGVGAEALGSLDGRTESSVDDQLGQDSQSTGDTEQDSVVVGFGEAVVLEEHSRVGINVGEGVFLTEE